jgi:hypothetical protein
MSEARPSQKGGPPHVERRKTRDLSRLSSRKAIAQ